MYRWCMRGVYVKKIVKIVVFFLKRVVYLQFEGRKEPLSMLRKLFKDTVIYGIATVLPRVLTLLLTRLYVNKLDTAAFGVYSGLYVYLILGNVVLSYGMETAFFRFMNKGERKSVVQSTALTSLTVSSLLFMLLAYVLRNPIARWLDYDVEYIVFAILILVLDALVVIPFAWLRNKGMSKYYALLRISNVALNLGLNLYYFSDVQVGVPSAHTGVWYIFMANMLASLSTLVLVLPIYVKIRFSFDARLWREMMIYAFPVLLAGIAFAVNEGFDRVFLRMLLPAETADSTIGVYSACYKMGVFMNLFVTAYKLGVEPFFFSNAQDKNAPKTYARVTEYFIIAGGFILLFITVFTDLFKHILIPNSDYWEALWIVPVVLLANLCLGIYHSLSVWYKVTDRTTFGAVISLVGMALTVIFNFLLIPLLSYKGAALATLITYMAMMLISYYYGQKYYPIPYKKRKIKFFLGMSVFFSLIDFYLLGRNIYVGVVFLLIYAVLGNAAIGGIKAIRGQRVKSRE
ncbi:Membrane protein involved in the export of O-antigen and teichoic acid [Capnocytophaga haemolytica]|uniref:Polysaccharide biosynthesis protein n=2 Tax=Capnocytophaga haemolytica TaxID=45243 RepID=A0AAX2GZA7_9FLAO|nr:Membrane protein involved in the export of O-antigen and teichoic acid [Capnocytophaga haemolytica]SNV12267.1 Polysaccharide biosynthesis protein [Capnocytophaga haemolytica]